MIQERGNDTDLLCIGSISKPHGIRGELKVISGLHLQDVFCSLKKVFLRKDDNLGEWKTIRNVRAHKNTMILQMEKVQTRNDAELFSGYDVYIRKDQIPEMPENTYFVFELVGLNVQLPNGSIVGRISDVMHMPAHDIYVIDTGSDEVLVPAVKEFIKQVDLKRSRMIIQPIDGMFDAHAD